MGGKERFNKSFDGFFKLELSELCALLSVSYSVSPTD